MGLQSSGITSEAVVVSYKIYIYAKLTENCKVLRGDMAVTAELRSLLANFPMVRSTLSLTHKHRLIL